ncbi:hypothetical protein BCV72DRAFT_237410 [Rhizopus microsporus var. microsporus]|uniref:C2H2-type domain-containing protein n=2 Tax=Rhizopus microsporus TaxID=58291 RepID=A0A2G4SFQ1_RHIZD|nr:uncharacterized protein RHIMIDRAFT_274473 [Rhizopus microsporus ATCC 52813]ORE00756.1 hypothetical protein BCV72DRAFT_237410 [Rhizopus microsporus var. microsporus]PHZ07594.1 hypothetical protein RHIMIDRAFT_274473 [Rhizopus microsporus ATCC 52813]
MSTVSTSPKLVTLIYVCHICEEMKFEGRNLRSHLLSGHLIEVPKLKRGQRHRDSLQYAFVKSKNNKIHQAIAQRYACPSCLSHFLTIDEYKAHVTIHIDPRNAELVVLPQKRKHDAARKFSTMMQPQNRANFPQEYIARLESIITVDQKEADKTNISTLKQFQHVEQLLHQALKQEVESLPSFLWGNKIAADPDEQKLINVTKFILTTFADTCSTIAINTKPNKDYERTFWVKYIVPVFQTFANQTGLLSLNWCEISTICHSNEDQDTTRYVDGMGYDKRRNERAVFEASSGQYNANADKIIDDSTKQISSMMSMLKGIASRHLNAKFETLLKTKVFGIQSIKTNLVLSEVLLREDGRYHYSEVRSAEVPTEYVERNRWIKVFEILCYLFVELKNQEVCYQTMEDEEQGAILVIPEITIKSKLNSNNI